MNIYDSAEKVIGNTPLIELKRIKKELNLKGNIFAKVEYFNPAGSIKDRAAKNMIDEARKEGLINDNTIIIEPTSGNTGIGLAFLGAIENFKVIIVMPDSMSIERIKLIKAYGAEVVLTPGKDGMKGSILKANELKEKYKNSFIPSQFNNKYNYLAHYKTTGPEIFDSLEGNIDYFVASIGTGGTITGVGKFLKEKNSEIKIIGVEPKSSPLLTKGYSGQHKIQGIGANFIPSILDAKIIEHIIDVENDDAFTYSRILAKKEGLLCGISSGAALYGAIEIAKKEENKDKNIVVILPDGGERYLSTELFKEE